VSILFTEQLILITHASAENSVLSFHFCRMIGSDESSTNYPGKIPDGLDLPSDVADEKLSENGPTN
jgi:hypothetical protein